MKNKSLRESLPRLDENWINQQLAQAIDLASTPADQLKRGEQWKVWLETGEKTHLDLIRELAKAPGKPKPGESLSEGAEVPFYEPGDIQWKAHQATEATVFVAGGWRAGKSKWLAAQLLPYMFKDWAHVWVVANDYKLARAEFNYVVMWLRWLDVPLISVNDPKEGSHRVITKWHATLETATGKEEDKIEMANLDAAGIAEAGQTDSGLLTKVRGRVFQKGGPIYISGSMVEAVPWYVNAIETYPNGDPFGDNRSFSIPSFDNKAAFPEGEQDEKIQRMKRNLPEDEYARKVLAKPMPPEGLVFKEFNPQLHVVPIKFVETTAEDLRSAMQIAYSPFESAYLRTPRAQKDGFKIIGWEVPEYAEVEIAVDPGYDPSKYAVLACVRHKDTILVFDEVYETEKTGEMVINICKERPWWPRVKRGTIDIAGKQHSANVSQIEVWRKETGITLQTIFVPILDGIDRYRNFLYDPKSGTPRMYIAPECEMLRWEHGQYRYPKNREEGNLRILPIDRHNHAIKAMTYYIIRNYKFSDVTGGTTTKRYIERRPISSATGATDWMDDFYLGRI